MQGTGSHPEKVQMRSQASQSGTRQSCSLLSKQVRYGEQAKRYVPQADLQTNVKTRSRTERNPEKYHPAFGQRRWRTNGQRKSAGTESFDVSKHNPVWFGYIAVKPESRL